MMYPRHTLLDITHAGRKRLFAEAVSRGMDKAYLGQMLLPEEDPLLDQAFWPGGGLRPAIPGIARRETAPLEADEISAGFVSWNCGEGGRMRLPVRVRQEEVAGAHSPVDVLRAAREDRRRFERTPALKALRRLCERLDLPGLTLGVWGSTGMELHTGYLYTHAGSDLDAYLAITAADPQSVLDICMRVVTETEQDFGLRIDPEVSLPSGYGVSLKELMHPKGATVLGKGLHDVILIRKDTVFEAAC